MNKTKTIALFINQIREKVGVMFGNPETTPGGRALKFYATIRLEVRRAEQIKEGTNIIGNRVRIKVVKNKVAPPFKRAEVDIMYGQGISQTGEIVDMAAEKDIVKKSGSWYSYGDDRIGQGRENAKKYLDEHPDVMTEIRQRFVMHTVWMQLVKKRLKLMIRPKKLRIRELLRMAVRVKVSPLKRHQRKLLSISATNQPKNRQFVMQRPKYLFWAFFVHT